ncbi:TetR/AcrR family transcriptional regulator [Leptospira levettii]|uniref:TetR/AcrR family transcriptional regulator n=1 Tax=Leptospira levettii TaxID=2023178 RepID=UPI00223D3941|nr:TetR/AcrR family transcriptional regulator [Leptospira levettii]MCW7509701.1 TetR/AcrR family transcriptional regulator [Leptospira levettii]MCW7520788.1 TetR/AcrR family transcriptional regulator [Leptospira levettii]
MTVPQKIPNKSDNKKQLARERSTERILAAAIVLFSKHGFAQTTMEMIANHAKISKGLAYNYFKSKNQIFEQIIDSHLAKQERFYNNIPPNLAVKEYVREFFIRSIQFAKEERKTMVLISVCLFQPSAVSLSKKMIENVERRFAPFKEAMRERFKTYGIKDPDKEMIFIKTFLHGLIMSQHFNDTTTCTPSIIEMLLERYDSK